MITKKKSEKICWSAPIPALVYTLEEVLKPGWAEEYESTRLKVKEATGYTWDNSMCRISDICGNEFAIMIDDHCVAFPTLVLWDYTGGVSLGHFDLSKTDARKQIEVTMELWADGKMRCCKCKKIIDFRKVQGNQIFAGFYCFECWGPGGMSKETKAMRDNS